MCEGSPLFVSYELSLDIAKAGKPFTEGDFVKKCILKAAERISPMDIDSYKKIALSRSTIPRRVEAMAGDVYDQLKEKAKTFFAFSIAIDESTDVSDTAQLVLFIRGVDLDLNVTEEFLDLIPMKDTTTGEDIFLAVEGAIEKLCLSWERLYSVTTDGAPSMRGIRKGFVALMKKKLKRPSMPSIHCLLHQESLCSESASVGDVLECVMKIVNKLRKHGLLHRQFQEFLKFINAEFIDVPYYCASRWLSAGNVLKRFLTLVEPIATFLDSKGKHEPKLADPLWVADLAFLVDLTGYLNDLNVSMQGANHLVTEMISKVDAFIITLKLWETQLTVSDTSHFPNLATQIEEHDEIEIDFEDRFEEYVKIVKAVRENFEQRFTDVADLRTSFAIFETPFSVKIDEVPSDLQLEVIKLQSNNRLKDRFYALPELMDFYRSFPRLEYPRLHKLAGEILSMFGSTYLCEQFFSVMKLTKPRLRAKLTDSNLRNLLRLSVTKTIHPNIASLVSK